jgi:hypothetical protein
MVVVLIFPDIASFTALREGTGRPSLRATGHKNGVDVDAAAARMVCLEETT